MNESLWFKNRYEERPFFEQNPLSPNGGGQGDSPKGKALSTFHMGRIDFLVSYLFTHERRFKDNNEEGHFFRKILYCRDGRTDGWTNGDKKGPLTFFKLRFVKNSDVY